MRIVAPKGWAQPWFLGNFWAKIEKKIFFFDFWHQNDSIREKKQKKIVECVECGPLESQDEFLGRSVIHRWNRTAKGYLLRKNDQILRAVFEKRAKNLILEHLMAPKNFVRARIKNRAP